MGDDSSKPKICDILEIFHINLTPTLSQFQPFIVTIIGFPWTFCKYVKLSWYLSYSAVTEMCETLEAQWLQNVNCLYFFENIFFLF